MSIDKPQDTDILGLSLDEMKDHLELKRRSGQRIKPDLMKGGGLVSRPLV